MYLRTYRSSTTSVTRSLGSSTSVASCSRLAATPSPLSTSWQKPCAVGDRGGVEVAQRAREACRDGARRPARGPIRQQPHEPRSRCRAADAPASTVGEVALGRDQPRAHALAQLAGGDPRERHQQQLLHAARPRRAASAAIAVTARARRDRPPASAMPARAARHDRTARARPPGHRLAQQPRAAAAVRARRPGRGEVRWSASFRAARLGVRRPPAVQPGERSVCR